MNVAEFEKHRRHLVAHAYRMLGDIGRAEELVQESWLRWREHGDEVRHPRAWLGRVVTRLCLNELDSARVRREEPRGTELPDVVTTEHPVDAEQISLAFLLLLQRLSPEERAALLLHEVFDFSHAEIGQLLDKTAVSSRKLLSRARAHIDQSRVREIASPEEHRRLLGAFARASSAGDLDALLALLAPDATLIVDAPPGTEFGGARNLLRPLVGRERVAAFAAQVTPAGIVDQVLDATVVNGLPALVLRRGGSVTSLITVHVVGDRIEAVYVLADPVRLQAAGL